MLDAWRSRLHTDCSALNFVRPVQTTDLTRCSTLNALRFPRIAPRSTPCARAGHGSPRATDCSVVQHLELCPDCGLLRPRDLAFHAVFGLLLARRFPLCTAHGLLRARCLALHAGLRIAPYADISRPCAVYGFLHVRHQVPHRHRLLCARRLTLRLVRGLLRWPYSAPRVDRGLLRRQHLELCIASGLLRLRYLSLRPERELLQVRDLALCSTYGLLRTLHLVPGGNRGLLRACHLVLRAGTFWYSLPNPTSEAVQVYLATRNESNYAPSRFTMSISCRHIFLWKSS
jgi:hypothetical protein